MKNLLLLALLAFATTTGAFAQARAGGELSSKDYTGGGTTGSRNTGFGIKGGYSLNAVRGPGSGQLPGRDNYNAFHGGVYAQIGFNEFSSVQAELLYARKGFRYSNATSNGQRNYRLDYLEIPVLYVGNITETLSFHVGPRLSLLTKILQAGENISIDAAHANSVDFGGILGAEARLGPARVGARYDLGFGNIFKDGNATGPVVFLPNSNTNIHNHSFEVYLGLGVTQ